ncbi:NAD(P)/FAD-dependent oxidoreductase [Sciscionella marina]|uniref:NAD(P)/FAD-dependent oxidoreductase n=1 Tax=Sciscionella marina TaxID=508770 RepID=UPI00036DC289|nr:FAD-dependent oxidoreductase [Sciscionella marina]
MSELPRSFVAVGGGQATASAVRTLRRRGFEGRVTVLADEPHAPYQRPPLSKEFLRGESTTAELTCLDEPWCLAHDVELLRGTRAVSVEPGRVRLEDGASVPGDAVLLATGARPRRLAGFDEERVVYLRTLDDAERLRELFASAERLVIIGGGLIGSEVASSARAEGLAVTVLEALRLPMLGQLGPSLARWYADLHREFGVDLRCAQRISTVESTTGGVVVRTEDDVFEADLIVVAVGAEPNDSVALESGLALAPAGGIVIDENCRTAMPGIFAGGDVAAYPSGDRHMRFEHFDNAVQQGTAVARALIGKPGRAVDRAPWFWSDQYGFGLQFVACPHPDAQLVVRGSIAERNFLACYLRDGTLEAAFAVGRGDEIPAVKELITAGSPVSSQTILDEETDLFELLDSATV